MLPSLVQIGNDALTVTVDALGAEMQSLTTAAGAQLLWHGDAAYWTGRSPLLFPIVGRAPNGRIAAGGHESEMAPHGFARRSRFTLVAADAVNCTHELTASDATRAVYPFDFRLTVTHALHGAALTVSVSIANEGDHPMPFGFGFHPAFLWPLPGAEGQTHQLQLDNRGEPLMARLRDGLLAPEPLPSPFRDGRLELDHEQFVADAMIFPEGAGPGLTYSAPGGPELRFSFENLPNLAVWTKPGAPFICIEPWHGMAAREGAGPEIADRPFSLSLPPGESSRFSFCVTVG